MILAKCMIDFTGYTGAETQVGSEHGWVAPENPIAAQEGPLPVPPSFGFHPEIEPLVWFYNRREVCWGGPGRGLRSPKATPLRIPVTFRYRKRLSSVSGRTTMHTSACLGESMLVLCRKSLF